MLQVFIVLYGWVTSRAAQLKIMPHARRADLQEILCRADGLGSDVEKMSCDKSMNFKNQIGKRVAPRNGGQIESVFQSRAAPPLSRRVCFQTSKSIIA
jgi:hypothetical protein